MQGDDEFESQVAILKEKVHDSVKEYKFTETTYKRYLRGFKLKVDPAVEGMIKYHSWRLEFNADNITEKDCPNMLRKEICVIYGSDKGGRPVLHVMPYHHDKYDRDMDEVRNVIIYTLNTILQKTIPTEERITILFDMTHFTLKSMDFEVVQLMVNILQKYYPEVLNLALIVNAPFVFSACWSVIRPWLDPVTAKKVEFVNSQQVFNFIEESQIPPKLLEGSFKSS